MIRPANLIKRTLLICVGMTLAVLAAPHASHALCATVKIEIRQELTLERQAFEAHMRINNGLSHIPIENVAVTVNFADEDGNPVPASSDPDNTGAQFFIRVDTMQNIENVQGTGSVAPATSADIHWLIIPAPGASNGLESGALYHVGATLTYTAAGQTETIEVTPDYIFVKPMPQLVLDYFLPTDVYGDDAWTDTVEAPVPFSLGLRISNQGHGYARNLKVESAQPRIVENQMGLLTGFQIDASTVNGQPASASLLVDFGDIAPDSAATARWMMSCTRSGRFVGFGAEFSHADELGGKLTSLIAQDDVRTHFLVGDVLVDAPGRDGIEDFLARDDDVYRIYESDGTVAHVSDQSAGAGLSSAPGGYRLSTPVTAGFMYARVADPFNGSMRVKAAIRSDGKLIKPANRWFSKTRAGSGPWQYHLNIFDHNTPGRYTLVFADPADIPQPPAIMPIPEHTRVEGQQLSFRVQATDPNGTRPSLSAQRLPIGASFVDTGDGSGVFTWTPGAGQAGRYTIKFVASDGILEGSRQARIRIFPEADSDGDGMPDSWELEQFATLDRDGRGDFDGDGICDLNEYLNGFDPTVAQSVPSLPEIIAPLNGEHVDALTPELEIGNSIDPEGDAYTYTFEVYADKAFKTAVASQADVAPQANTTQWRLPAALHDNTFYYWRVKATDATGSSNWAYGHFFTDTQNDPPTAPVVSYPADNGVVDTPTPLLEVINATDIDGDTLTCNFEVYADSRMTVLVAAAGDIASHASGRTSWLVDTVLDDGQWYYWRALAVDDRGARSASHLAAFQVNTTNAAPGAPAWNQPGDDIEFFVTAADLTVDNAVDPDGDILTYRFELDTDPAFNSPHKESSGQVLPGDKTTTWNLDGLSDNTRYFWRVNASDGLAHSRWTYGTFFVNTVNEPPPAPELKNPGSGAWVNTRVPPLAVHPVTDIDADAMAYRFEIYTDPDLTRPAGYAQVDHTAWPGVPTLNNGTWYHWRAQAVDQHGIPGRWSPPGSFFVKVNGVNLAPQLTFVEPSAAIVTNAQAIVIRWTDYDPDSSAMISFFYADDASGQDGMLIAADIPEDPDGSFDYHTWDISALEGTYYLYAIIADDHASQTVYCPAPVTIDRTPPTITVDPAGGTYTQALNVTLSTDESARIYYTLDGSQPGIDSAVYGTPLTIDGDTTLQLMAVDAAGNQSAILAQTYTFQAARITVGVATDKGRPLEAVRVYAFSAAGAYTGRYATTDGEGQAHFDPRDFTAGSYKFRIDHLGRRFWSQVVSLPATAAIDVVMATEPVTVSVDTAAGPAAGVRVYLFSESGAYLGQYLTTDAHGRVTFELPVDMAFTFRTDLYGNQYWSGVLTVTAGSSNAIPLNTGGGRLQAQVNKAADEPLTDIRVYLFNTSGAYLGHYSTTDTDGQVSFDVPQGNYRLRADYLGYRFWSHDLTITTDTRETVSIPHQPVQVAVESHFRQSADPLENIPVYLFSAAGSYLGQSQPTDAQGRVIFELPQRAYKVRADYLHQRFWSGEFTWQDPLVPVPMADAQVTVTGGGSPLEGITVYAFSAGGSYLGLAASTDATGQALYHLPAGPYLFRADYQGSRFWSAAATLTADQLHDIGISTGGGAVAFTVRTAPGEPLAGVQCYIFNPAGAYLGLQGTTDSAGQATFDLADGTYNVRVDYLGSQFWSQPIQVPAAMTSAMTIGHTPVDVTVLSAGGPRPDVRVYLFSAGGSYQGRYLSTDAHGRASFDLPAGVGYIFRADLLGNQYWSDPLTIPDSGPAPATIDTGGGRLTLTVAEQTAAAMPGLQVYLFSEAGAYLNAVETTDAAGQVFFDLAHGTYKLRADYLGYSFWTDAIQISQDTDATLHIDHQPSTVTVQGRFQGAHDPLASVGVYLFSTTGAYLGEHRHTDAHGQVVFDLPQQDYRVRADVMGRQYWSDTITAPDTAVTVPLADARVTVTGAGLPRTGIPIYLFSATGAYLGLNTATDAAGQATLRIPAAAYRFRADYQGSQYWSTSQVLTADEVNPVVVSVGGGTFALTVRRDRSSPMPGVNGYLFNAAGAYLGLFGATDSSGQVFFDLAAGAYQFRVDYLGHAYWSQTVSVPAVLAHTVELPHQPVTVTLSGRYLGTDTPLSGQQLYLFTPAGSYMGIRRTTDASGRAVFDLPDQQYKVRADYLGAQYWSPGFRFQDTGVQIAQGAVDIHVQRNGQDLSAARVYLFTPDGTYLGRYEVTDTLGRVQLILPQGDYRFRVDADGTQHWTADIQVVADQTGVVEVNLN